MRRRQQIHWLRLAAAISLMTTIGCTTSGRSPLAELDSGLHERLIVLDTHLDTPARMEFPLFDIRDRHRAIADDSQVDLPRMAEGGLDGGFWVIYTEQGPVTAAGYAAARESALHRAETIRDMVERHAQHFELAKRHSDAGRIAANGKRVVYQSIENAYPLGEDVSQLSVFFDFGVRMIGPVHSANNQFADSSSDPDGQRWGGLSPLGRQLVAEANRLGMILDGSHAHDETLDQLIELSATPIILSHSGPKNLYDHVRNVDDGRLTKLAARGGVIQVVALGEFLRDINSPPERDPALAALKEKYGPPRLMSVTAAAAYRRERRELEAGFPRPRADFEDFMTSLLHVLKIVGPDHVGIGADWDGGGGVTGMMDVSALPRITGRLEAAGYSEQEIANIWSGNVLRLLKAAEDHAVASRQ